MDGIYIWRVFFWLTCQTADSACKEYAFLWFTSWIGKLELSLHNCNDSWIVRKLQSIDWIFPLGNISPLIKHSSGALLFVLLAFCPGEARGCFYPGNENLGQQPFKDNFGLLWFPIPNILWALKRDGFAKSEQGFQSQKSFFFFFSWDQQQILAILVSHSAISMSNTTSVLCKDTLTLLWECHNHQRWWQIFHFIRPGLLWGDLRSWWKEGSGEWSENWVQGELDAQCLGLGKLRAGSPDTHLHVNGAGPFLAAALWISKTDP